jgi:uncharacterized RDD family membrane protein YckC
MDKKKVEYSGIMRRAISALIQITFVTFLLSVFFAAVIPYLEPRLVNLTDEKAEQLAVLALYCTAILFYLVFVIRAQSKSGAWWDMKIMRIKLLDEKTLEPLSYKRAALRSLAAALNSATLGIGYLLPFFNEKKQTLADKLCKTVVIKSGRRKK